MTSFNDFGLEMTGFRFDEATVDAFWSGGFAPQDAPPAFREIASLIQAARSPATSAELVGQPGVVAAMAAAVGTRAGLLHGLHWAGPRVLAKLASLKAAVTASVVTVGLGAAAATGSLPAPIQSAVSDGLSHFGISVPNPDRHPARRSTPAAGEAYRLCLSGAGPDTSTTAEPVEGPAPSTTATSSAPSQPQSGQSESRSSGQLVRAARANGETVQQFCTDAAAQVRRELQTIRRRPSDTTTTPTTTTPSTPSTSLLTRGGPLPSTAGNAPVGSPTRQPASTLPPADPSQLHHDPTNPHANDPSPPGPGGPGRRP